MAVRTKRLAVGVKTGANTSKLIYTCPAGHTAIVKDLRLLSSAPAAQQVIAFLRSGPADVYVIFKNGVVLQETLFVTGFVVLGPGDQILVFTSQAEGVNYWVSGSELLGVAP